ncbi:MAG: transcription antitermination factor NusB [Hymenobacteraceae bacterium]|nr:transcription antitermination factor NusB [Hymenobacteraceae bacterium]MDX5395349.1 transcription antitermination factor NusB [Hymenobacteraceae bacterium]MDX5444144.1 transcription antitermination factor NusB [Hymenobacteraceae bacterium]MDX5511400.1 transcription antitermination factor NusB [Hymenobacteraceae bacterium]
MQAIYAYMQAEGSDYLMALDLIEDAFAPDLNSMEVQDRKLLEGKKRIASALFKEWYETRSFDSEEKDPEILEAVNDAVTFYQNQIRKDFKLFGNQMLGAVEKIYDHYLSILMIVQEVVQLIEQEEQKKKTRFTPKNEPDYRRFLQNQVVQKLLNNKSFRQHQIRRNISWEARQEVVRQFYRETLKQDETFLEYLKQPETTFEEDQKVVKHIFKNIIFKEKNLQSLFEEQDLNWEENKVIVKSLVMKTVKMLDEQSTEDLALLDLSTNWEEDKAFFEELYDQTLKNEEKYEKLISQYIQNWDVERIAIIDKIILKMALCEMQLFRSIPVKVTINEYIEISKLYSTPKSKQFINGVLDKISQDLINKGEIRKSGRGLIDNR